MAKEDERLAEVETAQEVVYSCRMMLWLLRARAPDAAVRQVSAGRKAG